MVIDLHVVVPQGCDAAALDRLLNAGIESGLDGMLLLGAGAPPPVEAARTGRFGGRIALFFGIEFPLERGRLLWIPEDPVALDGADWRQAVGDRPTLASVAAVRERCGGVVLAAHPYDRGAGPAFVDAVFTLKNIDGVITATAPLDRTKNNMALEAAQRLGLAALGGSGSAAGWSDIGAAASVFPGAIEDQAALVAAIRNKDAWTVEMISRPDQLEPEGEGGRERDRGHDRDRGGPRGGYGRGDRGDRRDGRPEGRREHRDDRPRGSGSSGGPSGRPPREPGEPGEAATGAAAGEGGGSGRHRRRRRGSHRGPGEGGGNPPAPQATNGGEDA